MTDVERAYAALMEKQQPQTLLWRYHDGDHPRVYSNSKLREVFKGVDADFHANWCAVVVAAMTERQTLEGFTIDNSAAQDVLDTFWTRLSLSLEADDVHQAASVTGEAFIIAWKDDDADTIDAYYNDPRSVVVFYDPNRPRLVQWAAKWWVDEDDKRRLTLYYPDRLEYYVSDTAAKDVRSAKNFGPLADLPIADNPYGVVPVFHFRSERRTLKSDITDVIPLQDGINKLFIDMMVAADFGAFKQKYIISNVDTRGKLKNAPNEIWDLPAGDGIGQQTQAGQFDATPLANYLEAIDKLASTIGAVTRTPKHYFFTQSGDPSGESLLAMEAPLNKKARDRNDRFIPVWRQLAAFLLQLNGTAVDPDTIEPNYTQPETVQPMMKAQIAATLGNVSAAALGIAGYSQEEIESYLTDRQATPQPAIPQGAQPNASSLPTQPDDR